MNERFARVKNFTWYQIDVMDGKFVKNKSFDFDFKLPKGKKYEAHLMMKDPSNWIKKNSKKVDKIIIHYTGTKEVLYNVNLIKSKGKKAGLALNPEIKIKDVYEYLSNVDFVLIMCVHPGNYGGKFLDKMINKVRELRKLKPRLTIEVDGGIDDKTIGKLKKYANFFVIGSYLQNKGNVKKLRRESCKNF